MDVLEEEWGRIKYLQEKLLLLLKESNGNLSDPSVVAASQELDRVVVRLQRIRYPHKNALKTAAT